VLNYPTYEVIRRMKQHVHLFGRATLRLYGTEFCFHAQDNTHTSPTMP
jgi:hypothetical protein